MVRVGRVQLRCFKQKDNRNAVLINTRFFCENDSKILTVRAFNKHYKFAESWRKPEVFFVGKNGGSYICLLFLLQCPNARKKTSRQETQQLCCKQPERQSRFHMRMHSTATAFSRQSTSVFVLYSISPLDPKGEVLVRSAIKLTWNPAESPVFDVSSQIQLGSRLTETQGLRLPDEAREGRNRSWVVEEFSATL
ncbi:hypothetical protein CSKR_105890 [Clonorchis sinensis]|uniref:Uncharacterized protein n=1 Tax=Clonorchis sinensis TaxID=79923 RepID=A0A419QH91_CLOSI|nr:hypothetical protein CSKR_105890 [Clonorchis sinensis]